MALGETICTSVRKQGQTMVRIPEFSRRKWVASTQNLPSHERQRRRLDPSSRSLSPAVHVQDTSSNTPRISPTNIVSNSLFKSSGFIPGRQPECRTRPQSPPRSKTSEHRRFVEQQHEHRVGVQPVLGDEKEAEQARRGTKPNAGLRVPPFSLFHVGSP